MTNTCLLEAQHCQTSTQIPRVPQSGSDVPSLGFWGALLIRTTSVHQRYVKPPALL